MNVLRAEPTGLCFGVRRAIATLESALSGGRGVYAIGSPIHNPQEIARLVKKGLTVVESADAVPENAVAFIRAHGVAPRVTERLRARGVRVIDGTCPFVRVVQKRARQLTDDGYHLLILGDESHPEVAGILGHVTGRATVFPTLASLYGSTIFQNSGTIKKMGLVSQTTQEPRLLAEAAKAVVGAADELRVYNTICRATRERQKAVALLAGRVDGLIVIGGRDSANTGKLYRIAREARCDVRWIEHALELDGAWCAGKNDIGVAAGASTPDWLIDDTVATIRKIAGRQGDVRNE